MIGAMLARRKAIFGGGRGEEGKGGYWANRIVCSLKERRVNNEPLAQREGPRIAGPPGLEVDRRGVEAGLP